MKLLSDGRMNWLSLGMLFAFLLYGYEIVWLALHMGWALAPDEPHHIQLAKIFADPSIFSLEPSSDIVGLGAAPRYPYLAHLALGKLSLLNFFGIPTVIFMRLTNCALSMVGLWVAWKLICTLVDSTAGRLVVLFQVVNTLMFVVMGAAVSYDPWVNTAAIAGTYFAAKTILDFNYDNAHSLTLAALAGALTKVTFLPLVVVFAGVAIFAGRKQLQTGKFWKGLIIGATKKQRYLLLANALLLGLCVKLYGTNLIKYDGLYPSCGSVYGEELCAAKYAQDIVHKRFERDNSSKPRLDAATYWAEYWTAMEQTMYGFTGHVSFQMNQTDWKYTHRIFLLLGLIGALMCIKARNGILRSPLWILSLVLWVVYGSAVMAENYMSYVRLGVFGAGVQGRYFSPVLIPFYASLASPIFSGISARYHKAIVALLLIAATLGGLPFFNAFAPRKYFRGLDTVEGASSPSPHAERSIASQRKQVPRAISKAPQTQSSGDQGGSENI
jgi:hypothetical protein